MLPYFLCVLLLRVSSSVKEGTGVSYVSTSRCLDKSELSLRLMASLVINAIQLARKYASG
jgi:hypothetical protein